MKNIPRKKKSGFAIIEVMISLVIAFAFVAGFGELSIYATRLNRTNQSVLQGTLYAQEALEAAIDLEKSDWDALTDGTCDNPNICHTEITGGAWTIHSGDETLGGVYTRHLSVLDVYRDANAQMVESSGTIDPDTKHVVATVRWNNGFFDQIKNLETYVYKN